MQHWLIDIAKALKGFNKFNSIHFCLASLMSCKKFYLL